MTKLQRHIRNFSLVWIGLTAWVLLIVYIDAFFVFIPILFLYALFLIIAMWHVTRPNDG